MNTLKQLVAATALSAALFGAVFPVNAAWEN